MQIAQAQFGRCELAQLGHVFFSIGAGTLGQVTQEAHDLLGRLGHLGHQRHIGKAGVAQQLGLFLAQGQQLGHERAVVALSGAKLAGAGHVGPIQGFAQATVRGVLHHRQVAGHVQGELVALFALCLGRGTGGFDHVLRHIGQLLQRGIVRKLIVRVHHVLGKRLRLGRLQLLDLGKAFSGLALQLGTTQHKAAQGVFKRTGACRRQVAALVGLRQGLVLGVQALIGTQARVELGQARQVLVVSRTQLGRVGHAVEVSHGAPGPPEVFRGHVQQQRERVVIGGHVRPHHLFQRLFGLLEQDVHGRRDMFRLDLVEQGQAGGFEQGVRVHVRQFGAKWADSMRQISLTQPARPLPWC